MRARDATYQEQLAIARTKFYKGLNPLDLRQCMAEFKEPHQPFKIGFPAPRWQRCDRQPCMVAVEALKDRLTSTRGAMSLCRSCAVKCKQARPEALYSPSAPFHAAFKLGGHEAVVALIYSYGLDG